MAPRHISMRGEAIDMNRLRSVNANTPALGNANLNARGDILGQGGIVIKTQEQIEQEWAANKAAREASVRPVDIKSEMAMPAAQPPRKQLVADDQFFDPIPAVTEVQAQPVKTTRRKITETDE